MSVVPAINTKVLLDTAAEHLKICGCSIPNPWM